MTALVLAQAGEFLVRRNADPHNLDGQAPDRCCTSKQYPWPHRLQPGQVSGRGPSGSASAKSADWRSMFT